MDKIAINPNRLEWCCETLGMDVNAFHQEISIAKKTLEQAMQAKAVLSIKQLENIAKYFNRHLLFFLEPSDVVEERIYSLQFRTINNQQPIQSQKLRKFISTVETHRKVYLSLLEDLNIPISQAWQDDLRLSGSLRKTADVVRHWLGLEIDDKFDDLRDAVEKKGIMVIVSNGYNGRWQIDKKDLTRGFCLNYDTLPIIAIKKQSKGAQAFTLMHELAHLLLHKTSMLDNESAFHSYQGKEKEANIFASNILMPDALLSEIDLDELQNLNIQAHDNYLAKFKKQWCVSGDAILYRLFLENKITQEHYQAYKNFKEEEKKRREQEEQRQKELGNAPIIPRTYRHREPINMFGKTYVATVLDAQQNNHITLAKASTYLDNLKIHTLHKLEADFVSS